MIKVGGYLPPFLLFNFSLIEITFNTIPVKVKQIVKNILKLTNTAPNPAIVNIFASVSFISLDDVILLW